MTILVRRDALWLAQLWLLFAALARGIDYMTTPAGRVDILSVTEQAFPLKVWGALFVAFAVLGFVGEVWRARGDSVKRYWPSYTAHSALMGLYVVSATGSLLGLIIHGDGFGWRAPIESFGYAIGHWVFTRRLDTDAH